ncbi:MAG: UbiD family decarboxylase, partial [Planctomycetaceae bacterium]
MNWDWDHLADYLAWLQDQGDLVRITPEVDPVFELTEIVQRMCRAADGGPAVFFEHVRGSTMPIVANLLGAERRLRVVLRTDSFDAVGEKMVGRVRAEPPRSWWDLSRWLPHWSEMIRMQPVTIRTAPCQQVIRIGRDLNLGNLPIPHLWPQETGKSITAGQVCFQHPDTGERRTCLTSLEVLSEDRLRIYWPKHHPACRYGAEYVRQQRQMPIAVVLGGDPLFTFLSAAPLPEGIDPYLWAGFMRGRPVELVKCRTHDLEVPAGAEIVVEGFLDSGVNRERTERENGESGHLVQETGWINPPLDFPTLQVTSVTQRSNPLFPVIVHGGAGHEDYWIGKAIERMLLSFIKLFQPEIIDWHFPRAGRFHHLLFVKIRKEFPDQARKVMQGIWSLYPTVHAKIVIVVDEEVDVHNEEQVWFYAGSMIQPRRDTLIIDGPINAWDQSAVSPGVGQRIGFDATRRWKEEGAAYDAPPR